MPHVRPSIPDEVTQFGGSRVIISGHHSSRAIRRRSK